jgi:endogenous inhibitor of DNA gyrase (YacG/DUF329 family)
MSDIQVKCPTCGRVMVWDASSAFRPFCSERCKLIDLGAWLTERHAIAGEPAGTAQAAEEGESGSEAEPRDT